MTVICSYHGGHGWYFLACLSGAGKNTIEIQWRYNGEAMEIEFLLGPKLVYSANPDRLYFVGTEGQTCQWRHRCIISSGSPSPSILPHPFFFQVSSFTSKRLCWLHQNLTLGLFPFCLTVSFD
jgi:hypothetical protein